MKKIKILFLGLLTVFALTSCSFDGNRKNAAPPARESNMPQATHQNGSDNAKSPGKDMENAGNDVKNAAEDAARGAGNAVKDAGEAVKDTGKAAKDAAENAAGTARP